MFDNTKAQRMNREGLFSAIRKLKEEFKRIHWTSKKELVQMTKIVLSATLLGGFAIYVADLSIQEILNIVIAALHWVMG